MGHGSAGGLASAARGLLARRELERRRAKADPAFLMSFMSAPDERTGDRFTFEHMRYPAPTDKWDGLWPSVPASEVLAVPDRDWSWQRDAFLWLYHEPRSIALKARQLGFTWLACGCFVVDALTIPGALGLVYRQKEEEAHENVRRCWDLLQSLPKHLWMDAEVIKPIKGALPSGEIRLQFPDAAVSRIVAMTSASASGHGKTARRVNLDEHSRIERASEIMKAVQPAAGKQGKICLTSTANGVSNPDTGGGNQFHWVWTNGEEGGFSKRFFSWAFHPGRDQDWYDHDPEVRGLKSHERAEQYPANEHEAFTLTNRVFFEPDDLVHYAGLVEKPRRRGKFVVENRKAVWREKSDGMIRVFRDPVADHAYAIGADVATGRGLDYSAAYVVDLATMELCAEFRGRLDQDLYAEQLHFLGRWFNTALIAVETAGATGDAVIIPLRDGRTWRPRYPRLYQHTLSARADMPQMRPYGFPTSRRTRPLILNQLDKALRDRSLPFITSDLLSECQTFIEADTDPSPRAQNGAHDDCVMACAIALEMYRMYGQHPERDERRAERRANKPRVDLRRRWRPFEQAA